MKAVAIVTINRVKNSKFPGTICDVVYQPKQFSWTLSGTARIRDTNLFLKIRGIAAMMYSEYYIKGRAPKNLEHLENVLFFSVQGFKNKNLVFITKIGEHKFYSLERMQ